MFQKKSTDMLEGSPLWSMVFFAMPMIIGNLFQQFYNMADSAIVGKFVSENALAAVGASYSLTNVFICIAIGGGVGASVLTSQYLGGRDYGSMKTADQFFCSECCSCGFRSVSQSGHYGVAPDTGQYFCRGGIVFKDLFCRITVFIHV